VPPGLGKGKKQVVLPAPEVPVPLLCGLELMEAPLALSLGVTVDWPWWPLGMAGQSHRSGLELVCRGTLGLLGGNEPPSPRVEERGLWG
jgi:hypothetical protein